MASDLDPTSPVDSCRRNISDRGERIGEIALIDFPTMLARRVAGNLRAFARFEFEEKRPTLLAILLIGQLEFLAFKKSPFAGRWQSLALVSHSYSLTCLFY